MTRSRVGMGSAFAVLLMTVAGVTPAMAATPHIVDGAEFGTSQYDGAYAVVARPNGLFVAGVRNDSVADQDGAGFVRRFDAAGGTVWTHVLDTAGSDEYDALAVRGDYVYAAGSTTGFPDQPNASPRTDWDAFIEKLAIGDGHRLWVKRIHTAGDDFGDAIAADATGIYLIGIAGGALSNCQPAACAFLDGGSDGFVRRYDVDGAVGWTREFGTTSFDNVSSWIASAGALFVAGTTGGVLQSGHVKTGYQEGYIRRYEQNGSMGWTRQFGAAGGGYMSLEDLAGNPDGVYAVGHVTKGLAGTGYTVAGEEDAYVRMYAPGGALRATRQFGSNGTDSAGGVAATSTAIFVGGDTDAALYGSHHGGLDGWARRFDTSSSGLTNGWMFQFGSGKDDSVYRAAHSDLGTFVAGGSEGNVPGCSPGCSYNGNGDAFWVRLQ
jgi:hypothetical protein